MKTNTKTAPVIVTLKFRALPSSLPLALRVRGLLKIALRRFGLRSVFVDYPVSPGVPEGGDSVSDQKEKK